MLQPHIFLTSFRRSTTSQLWPIRHWDGGALLIPYYIWLPHLGCRAHSKTWLQDEGANGRPDEHAVHNCDTFDIGYLHLLLLNFVRTARVNLATLYV